MSIVGRPIEESFTPPADGLVTVTVVFDMMWDAGSTMNMAAALCEQGGVTTYGEFGGTQKRQRQTLTCKGSFLVTAGTLVKVGLACEAGSIRRVSFWNLNLQAVYQPAS